MSPTDFVEFTNLLLFQKSDCIELMVKVEMVNDLVLAGAGFSVGVKEVEPRLIKKITEDNLSRTVANEMNS